MPSGLSVTFGPVLGALPRIEVSIDPRWEGTSRIFEREAIPVALRAIRKFSEEIAEEGQIIFRNKMRAGGHNATGQLSRSLSAMYPHHSRFQPRVHGRYARGIPTGLYFVFGVLEDPAKPLPKQVGKLPREYAYSFEAGSRPASRVEKGRLSFYRILNWVKIKGIQPRFETYQAGHFWRNASVETVAHAIWRKIQNRGVRGNFVFSETASELEAYINNNAGKVAKRIVDELLREIGR